jgi:tRNA(Ile)-lysidine synthase
MAALRLTQRMTLALGLSGGGDSVALGLLLEAWGATPVALIVDHGLREGSGVEAKKTAAWAKTLGFDAEVLRWRGTKPGGNVEDAAREARYGLMGAWCRKRGVPVLLIAHTREDQAETFLLRLGRGSGVDGLAAMAPESGFPLPGHEGIGVARPLLGFGRDELRAYAKARGEDWIEDPMNGDERFARTRIRRMLPLLAEAGIPASRIVLAAQHAARAREALESATEAFLGAHARFDGKGARIDGAALAMVPREIGLRALAAVLGRVSGQGYRPRFERLERLFDALTVKEGHVAARTLHGCRIGASPKGLKDFGARTLSVTRERGRERRPPAS